jgi:hypothetical protein
MRAERDDHLRDAELAQCLLVDVVEQRLGLLLRQLEHREMAQDHRVELLVEGEGAFAGDAQESLRVEREASPSRERRHRLRGEIRPRECAEMDPERAGCGSRDPAERLVRRPGLADALQRQLAPFPVVAEAERGRRRRRAP